LKKEEYMSTDSILKRLVQYDDYLDQSLTEIMDESKQRAMEFAIDENDLLNELVVNAALFAHIGHMHNVYGSVVNDLELDLRNYEGNLKVTLRSNTDAKGKAPSVDAIDSLVKSDEIYMDKMQSLNAARRDLSNLAVDKEACRLRVDLIRTIVKIKEIEFHSTTTNIKSLKREEEE
jgi:hypothetical protein